MLYGIAPLIVALYLHECWTIVSRSLMSACVLSPTIRSSAVRCLRRLGFDVYPYHPRFAEYPIQSGYQNFTPLAGVPNATTLFCKEAGSWELFPSDRNGFSNPDSVWNEKNLDVVLLGDSFVLGECVPQSKRFATLIQAAKPKTLNLGYSSSSLLTHYARFREYAKSRKPEHIFLFYYEGNDPLELILEIRNPLWKSYLESTTFTQNLEENSESIGFRLRPWLKKYIEKGDPYYSEFRLTSFFKLENTRKIFTRLKYPQSSASLFNLTNGQGKSSIDFLSTTSQILRKLKKTTAPWNGKLHFVYLPSYRKEERGFYPELRELVEKQGIHFVDMAGIFDRDSFLPYTTSWPNHYTVEANEKIAEVILQVLGSSPTHERLAKNE